MLIYIDGPEKVGKTTLAKRVAEVCRPLHAIHVGLRYPRPFDPTVYLDAVKLATRPDVVVVLDRGWLSDVVYSRLSRGSPPSLSPVEYEVCLGLPARSLGVRVVCAPPERLSSLDETDLQILYESEVKGFLDLAERFGYEAIDPTTADPKRLVDEAKEVFWWSVRPPVVSGSRAPTIAYVGERRNDSSREVLAWAPCTTRYWLQEFRAIENELYGVKWNVALTNAADLDEAWGVVKDAAKIVAYGSIASLAVLSHGRTDAEVRIHPSARWRWGKYTRKDGAP